MQIASAGWYIFNSWSIQLYKKNIQLQRRISFSFRCSRKSSSVQYHYIVTHTSKQDPVVIMVYKASPSAEFREINTAHY